MDEDNGIMAPAFEEEGLEQDSNQGRGPPSTTSVAIESDTSWLAGGGVGYHLQVHSEDGARWMCVRRYSEFAMLREVLIARCQQPSTRSALLALPFPEKRWLGSADLDTVKERRRELERWMNGAITLCPADADVLAFLSPHGARNAGQMTPGGSGSFSGASGALGSDAEDWAELQKVRQLRESLLRGQLQESEQMTPDKSGILGDQTPDERELEPERDPDSAKSNDDLLEMLLQEAVADTQLDSNFTLPPLRQSALATTSAGPPPSPSTSKRRSVSEDLSLLDTPPRPAHGVSIPFEPEPRTPLRSGQHESAETNHPGDRPEQVTCDTGGYERLLRVGGKQSLESICTVLDRVVPLLDVPQKHTPRRRRRLLEDRVEKLLALLRPTESGSELQQRWAAAAALMQLEPSVASELARGLAELAALPTQSAYTGYSGLSASAVITLASVLRTLEVAAEGQSAGNLLEREVFKKLSNGGETAVACVATTLEHCLVLVDIPQAGVPRRYRRALEHDILEAQLCLERGLGLKLAGRGLQPPLLDALVQAVVSVHQLSPSELLASDAAVGESPLQTAASDVAKGDFCGADGLQMEAATVAAPDGLLSEKTRLDTDENVEETSRNANFAAMQRLLRLLVRPDTDPEVVHARKQDARITELRVARRREQRITAALARKTWGPADEETGKMLPTATEKLRLQQEEEASAILRMRMLEAKEEMKQREKEKRQARLALNRQRRARQAHRRRMLGLCSIAATAAFTLVFRSRLAAISAAIRKTFSGPVAALYGWVRTVVLSALGRAYKLIRTPLGHMCATLRPVWMPARRKLLPVIQAGVEIWAQVIDRLVQVFLNALRSIVIIGTKTLGRLRLQKVLLKGTAVFKQALLAIRRQ